MKQSILLLVLLASVLPEILTGSTSISAFFNPFLFLILLVGYGLAVLLIREIAIRNNLSFGGIYILGIIFGIFNEGLLAKTLIKTAGLPIAQYDNYGHLLGINFPFTLVITFWHAMAAVLIPILIVYWFYPENAKVPWLNKTLTLILSSVLLLLGSILFLGELVTKGNLVQLTILLGLIVILFCISKRFTKKSDTQETQGNGALKPVWLGMSIFFPYFLLLTYIAEAKLPLWVFFVVFTLIIFGYCQILRIKNWLTSQNILLFGIGVYIQNAIFGTIVGLSIPATLVERVATGVLASVFLIWFAIKVTKSMVPAGKLSD